jgi:hypothetical protein
LAFPNSIASIEAKARADPPAGPNATQVQYRLPDGKRIVKKFAKDDIVRTLFEHLKAIQPDLKPFEVCDDQQAHT